jgi:hypothetical protein
MALIYLPHFLTAEERGYFLRKRRIVQVPRRVISMIPLFLLFVFVIPSSAQVGLPEIIKRIEPSVVLITTYNEAGKELATGSGFFV